MNINIYIYIYIYLSRYDIYVQGPVQLLRFLDMDVYVDITAS